MSERDGSKLETDLLGQPISSPPPVQSGLLGNAYPVISRAGTAQGEPQSDLPQYEERFTNPLFGGAPSAGPQERLPYNQ